MILKWIIDEKRKGIFQVSAPDKSQYQVLVHTLIILKNTHSDNILKDSPAEGYIFCILLYRPRPRSLVF
jgi:hypothetical protein